MIKLLLAIGFVLIASVASAQATSSKILTWEQINATGTEAAAMTFRYSADEGQTETVLAGVTCEVADGVTLCHAPFPAFTPGRHSLTMTAENEAGEGLPSTPFTFTFVVLPNAPTHIRIEAGP